jgi:hypothetical protein
MMQPIKLDRGTKRGDRLGRFVVEILHAGLALTATTAASAGPGAGPSGPCHQDASASG